MASGRRPQPEGMDYLQPCGCYSGRLAGIVAIVVDVSRPHTAVCPTLDSEVLAVLAGTTRPLTGREVARLVGRKSHSGVLDVLNRLATHGVVDRQEAGNALLFVLNRDHLAAPAVEALARMRAELFHRLGATVNGWEIPPTHASVFGSAARGEGDAGSDIDIFIVRPRAVPAEDPSWRTQVDDLATSVRRWTGNRAGIAEVGEDQLEELLITEAPIIQELHSDALVIAGPNVGSLLRRRPDG